MGIVVQWRVCGVSRSKKSVDKPWDADRTRVVMVARQDGRGPHCCCCCYPLPWPGRLGLAAHGRCLHGRGLIRGIEAQCQGVRPGAISALLSPFPKKQKTVSSIPHAAQSDPPTDKRGRCAAFLQGEALDGPHGMGGARRPTPVGRAHTRGD